MAPDGLLPRVVQAPRIETVAPPTCGLVHHDFKHPPVTHAIVDPTGGRQLCCELCADKLLAHWQDEVERRVAQGYWSLDPAPAVPGDVVMEVEG